MTEFKWYDGPVCHKLYLSAILDLYDRSIVAYVLSRRNDNRLVFQTFEKAIANNPSAKPIFHSDRGFQYTGRYFRSKLKAQEIEQSMSWAAHCVDNGPVEGFGELSSLKCITYKSLKMRKLSVQPLKSIFIFITMNHSKSALTDIHQWKSERKPSAPSNPHRTQSL